ncbi:MAG: hypothetical protein PF481_11720 [Bacteroidales bacterium]|jgi:hypothetical protein|nr:hypothetical protein [Bacteroidales bacterium]
MNIFAEYSLWFIPLFVLISLSLSFLLYRKDRSFKEAPRWIRSLLFALRAIVVFSLLVLLLGVFVNIFHVRVEKPVVLVLQDNSQSVTVTKDADFYTDEYPAKMDSLLHELSNEYEVFSYSFGESVEDLSGYSFSQKETDIAGALEHVSDRFFTRNVGAVILASDGMYTRGNNPLYAARNLSFDAPVYSLLLGDSVQAKDVVIHAVQANEIVFRNTPFPVKLDLRAFSVKGQRVRVSIFSESKKIFSKEIFVDSDEWYQEEICYISSDELGKQIFRVELEHIEGEISYENNAMDFIVDVLESRQKIAVVYNHVHPDVGAITQALQSNKHYDVQAYHISDFDASTIHTYNCIVFHGLPEQPSSVNALVESAYKKQVPAVYMYNTSMNMNRLPQYGSGLSISAQNNNFDEVSAAVDKQFALFQITDAFSQFLSQAPSLNAPYGSYTMNPEADVCLWQTVGGIQVSRPLLLFYESEGVKRASFLAEGLWRWRLFVMREQQSSELFDVFINNIIRYVSLTETRSLFRVSSKEVFTENQDIMLYAELYDYNFQLVMDEAISLQIRDSIGTEYTYMFTPQSQRYVVNAGSFPPGKYTYKASCTYNNKQHSEKGIILVTQNQKEFISTRAQAGLMREVAQETGGSLFVPQTMSAILDSISRNVQITPVSHSSQKRANILDYWQLLLILVIALSVEWFLRKFYGGV